MNQEALLKSLLTEIRELKAMVAQLGAVQTKTTVAQEVAACRAQGIDVATYFKAKGAAAPRRKPNKEGKKCPRNG